MANARLVQSTDKSCEKVAILLRGHPLMSSIDDIQTERAEGASKNSYKLSMNLQCKLVGPVCGKG